MTHPARRKQKPVRWLPKPDPPPLPPKRYCPRCEREVEGPDLAFHMMIYDCTTCEKLLFESEVDSYPGQTKEKGKQNE